MPDKITTFRLPDQYQTKLEEIKKEIYLDPELFNTTDTILYCIAYVYEHLEINKKTDEK